jgi:hypothetical protein
MPACAVTSVNVIELDGRAGADADAVVVCAGFEVSAEGWVGGGAEFDLQPAM